MSAFSWEEPIPAAAVRYARDFGWYVFPISPSTKRPAFEHQLWDGPEADMPDGWCVRGECGHRHASNDPEAIAVMFAEYPDAWIGVHCATSGLVVIDIDPRNGGRNPWQNGDQPATWTARTRSGGTHLFFKAKPGAEYPATLGEGVDVKHNGYVVVAPSPGYRWCLDGVRLADWPGRTFEQKPAYEGQRFEYQGDGGLTAEAKVMLHPYVERLREAVSAGHDRNNSLYVLARQAGQLVGGGEAHEADTLAWLERTGRENSVPGWKATVRSGFRKGLQHDPPLRLRRVANGIEYVDVRAAGRSVA